MRERGTFYRLSSVKSQSNNCGEAILNEARVLVQFPWKFD